MSVCPSVCLRTYERVDGCQPNLVNMRKGSPSRSSQIWVLIRVPMWIQDNFFTFLKITRYALIPRHSDKSVTSFRIWINPDSRLILVWIRFYPLMGTGNYSATSNNMKLVHWPLMGGLLHLVQRREGWEASHRCTKCNSPPPVNG